MLERADGAICTGGLGPTVDDLTKDAVARAVRRPLVLHEPSLRAIEERFRQFGRPMAENNVRQAYLPEGCVVFDNPHGTAPGFVALRDDGRFVACMPGVPREMKPMLAEQLIPWLVQRFGLRQAIYTRTLHVVGIGESDLDRRVEDLFRTLENPKIAMLAHGGRVDVKVMAKADSPAARGRRSSSRSRPSCASGSARPGTATTTRRWPARSCKRSPRAGLTLGTAESCTGGAIADEIVAVPGASAGVSRRDRRVRERREDARCSMYRNARLSTAGAVSEETAVAMARGARARLGADVVDRDDRDCGPRRWNDGETCRIGVVRPSVRRR